MPRCFPLVAATALAVIAPLAPSTAHAATAITAVAAPKDGHDVVIDELIFPGGTVRDLVAALREAVKPALFNVVLDPYAAEAPIAPFEVRGVSPRSIFKVALPDGMVEISDPNDRLQRVKFRLHHTTVNGQDSSTDVSRIETMHFARVDSPTASMSVVPYSIASLVSAGLSADDVLGAVESAVLIDSADVTPELNFHPPTSTLIVRGTEPQHGLVSQVLSRLERTADVLVAERNQAAFREHEIDEVRVQVSDLERQLHDQKQSLTDYKLQATFNSFPKEEVTRRTLEMNDQIRDTERILATEVERLHALEERANRPTNPVQHRLHAQGDRLDRIEAAVRAAIALAVPNQLRNVRIEKNWSSGTLTVSAQASPTGAERLTALVQAIGALVDDRNTAHTNP